MPGDLTIDLKVAFWFGVPYNKWFVGTITSVNRRRTKTENVEAEFEGGPGQLVCTAETYGIDKAWVLVREQIDLEGSSRPSSPDPSAHAAVQVAAQAAAFAKHGEPGPSGSK